MKNKQISFTKAKYNKGFWVALISTLVLLGVAIGLAIAVGIRFSFVQGIVTEFNSQWYAAITTPGTSTFEIDYGGVKETFNISQYSISNAYDYDKKMYFNTQEEEIWIYLTTPSKLLSDFHHKGSIEFITKYDEYSSNSNSLLFGMGVLAFLLAGVSGLCTVFLGLPVTLKNKNLKKEYEQMQQKNISNQASFNEISANAH